MNLREASNHPAWERIDGRNWHGATRTEVIEVVLEAVAATSRPTIGREEWNRMRPTGEEVELRVTSRPTSVNVEADDGTTITANIHADGADVRIGVLQVVVNVNDVTLLQPLGPYPIQQWAVLWTGRLA